VKKQVGAKISLFPTDTTNPTSLSFFFPQLPREDTFWSSKGSEDMLSSEWLVYKLRQPICAIFSVTILPFQASFQQGFVFRHLSFFFFLSFFLFVYFNSPWLMCRQPTYAPRAVRVMVGFSPTSWHWTSPTYEITNTHGWNLL
jgi:hypothetical protein